MTPMTCDICGGRLAGKADGIFECENCGMTYTTEYIRSKYQQFADKVEVTGTVKVEGTANADSLIKRGFMELEDGRWEKADELFEDALNSDPENGRAYLGKLMIDLGVLHEGELSGLKVPFDGDKFCQKAMRFGDSELKALLENSNIAIRKVAAERPKKMKDEIISLQARIENNFSGEVLTESEEEDYLKFKEAEYLKLKIEADEAERKFIKAKSELDNCREKTELERQRKIVEANRNKINNLGVFKGKEKKALEEENAALGSQIYKLHNAISVKQNAVISAQKTMTEGKAKVARFICNLSEFKKRSAELKIMILRAGLGECKEFQFGRYPQDNYRSCDTFRPIDWEVLSVEAGRILVISKHALICGGFNTSFDVDGGLKSVTWETCSLRKWLNEDFYNRAFSAAERETIETTNLTADKNPEHSTDPGKDTKDKVFLLSIIEAEKYFADDYSRRCAPTVYAKQGLYTGLFTKDRCKTASGEEACCWWLRSPGNDQRFVAYVDDDGSVYYYGGGNRVNFAVRPAMWLNPDSLIS